VPLHLSVITPARPVVELEVDHVVAPGREGEFDVLPGHELFLAPLRPGVVRFGSAGREQRLAVSGGFAEVTHDSVTLLAPAASRPGELDRAQVQAELASAEAALADLGPLSPPQAVAAASERVELAKARLAVLD
jgi:F-type H+-transporting ATPase subunit epsilon